MKKALVDRRDPLTRCRDTIGWFSTIYLGGIPSIITNDSAFLAFICIVSATETLSGYRYGGENLRSRFVRFVRTYYPSEYGEHAEELYTLRKKLVHAFSTGIFDLIHHRSHFHLRRTTRDRVVLNAEDLYSALLSASQRYFAELEVDTDLQARMVRRLDSEGGGTISVHSIAVVRSKQS